jgi:MoxR-like ATPase
MKEWWIYKGIHEPHDGIEKRLPAPPPWRHFIAENTSENNYHMSHEEKERLKERASGFQVGDEEIDMVNAALYLRRPLLITGKPGSGKSTLAYAVAYELNLGPVLRWPITTNVTLQQGLYHYDAIGRLQQASLAAPAAKEGSQDAPIKETPDIGQYLRLGPLGTALLPGKHPRVLLIDEIDKSDIDLPNNLLHIFEEGEYEISELMRLPDAEVGVMTHDSLNDKQRVMIKGGRVRCTAFPFVVLTSNQEREFPPAFLRRCIRLEMNAPDEEKLSRIVAAHLGPEAAQLAQDLIKDFVERRNQGDQATDQLLNALYMVTRPRTDKQDIANVIDALLKPLTREPQEED